MKKHRSLALFLLLLIFTPCLQAQKKELGQARSYIKSGKDFDKAEKLMNDLLEKDSTSRTNDKVHLTLYTAVMKQYEAANEKLYLKQQYDTTAFFGITYRLYTIAERLDSLDSMQSGEKKRLRYREGHARQLDQLRPNLYFGGTYLVRKGDYEQAYRFFDTYLQSASHPLFTGYDYAATDARMPQAAYWATFSGYKMKDADLTLRYAQQALADTAKASFTLQHICEAYQWKSDESSFLSTLQEGFRRYPSHPYFFPRIEDYYISKGDYQSALTFADEALQSDSTAQLFLLAKSTCLLNLERYNECVKVSERLIAQCDTMPEPYFSIASVHLNRALVIEKSPNARQHKAQIQKHYRDAMPYMERYRQLAPDEKLKWAPALYRIYLNLNMGKQFEEIDRLMHQL